MITRDAFWKIMESYGATIWPVQLVFYFVAILLVVWLLVKPGRIQDILIKLYLAVAFAWNGIMFYLTLANGMAGQSHGNYIFGVLFLLVAVLFLVDAFRQKMHFFFQKAGWLKNAHLLLLLLVFCYPVFGLLSEHGFTSLIFPGTFPCPTTALALLLLVFTLPIVNRIINVLLLFFAIPFTPFFQIARYGVYEDVILVAVGIYSLMLWVVNRKSVTS
jgi:hypothetical protein